VRYLQRHEIIDAFPKRHRKKVVLPVLLETVRWSDLEFLGWIDIGSARGFMVMEHHGEMRGLLLSRSSASTSIKRHARMCDLCKTIHGSQGVRLFVAEDTRNPNRKIGNDFCDDLLCSLRIRHLVAVPPNQMPETIGMEEKAVRILEGAEQFFDQCY
jgi:hypothetical protein